MNRVQNARRGSFERLASLPLANPTSPRYLALLPLTMLPLSGLYYHMTHWFHVENAFPLAHRGAAFPACQTARRQAGCLPKLSQVPVSRPCLPAFPVAPVPGTLPQSASSGCLEVLRDEVTQRIDSSAPQVACPRSLEEHEPHPA